MKKSISKSTFEHDHSFGQDQKKPGELRTFLVITITVVMMVVEIAAGILFGSMALLADGLHMASHAAALGISAFAYIFARKHAHDPAYSFGTGKVNALGGYSGAVLLLVFAVIMVGESIHRLLAPVDISFNQAIGVAVVGLIVNGLSVLILGHDDHHHHHDHGHDHHQHHEHHDHHHHHGDHHHHDHNLKAAYFHVLADTLTSLLAIVALLTAKYFGWIWMDPVMGIVGALVITKWSFGLLAQTGALLLDKQGPMTLREGILEKIEKQHEQTCVHDLHVWSIGPGIFSAAFIVVSDLDKSPRYYKELLSDMTYIVHTTIEVHQVGDDPDCQTSDLHCNN
jgi:cation diffusion facilitator family transporter